LQSLKIQEKIKKFLQKIPPQNNTIQHLKQGVKLGLRKYCLEKLSQRTKRLDNQLDINQKYPGA